MTNYICSVSSDFPENYEIGLRACVWGVEEKYMKKISQVRPGDQLIFIVGGDFRSIHSIVSTSYFDDTPLWPEKDESLFPYRIKISDPVATGRIPAKDVADQISFMRGKAWHGTIRGQHGVFNPRLTDNDVNLLRKRMDTVVTTPSPLDSPEILRSSERQDALFKFYESDVEDRILQLLPSMGLKLFQDPDTGRNGKQYPCGTGRIDVLCLDRTTNQFVILELKKGEAPNETLLQLLRYMSWVRQHLAGGKDVRGVIVTESADRSLVNIVGEVPNVSIQYYKLSLELINP